MGVSFLVLHTNALKRTTVNLVKFHGKTVMLKPAKIKNDKHVIGIFKCTISS